jgi:hypothetical protein
VVDRPGEHSFEFRLPDSAFKHAHLSSRLGNGRVVALGGTELQEDGRIFEVAPELLERGDALLKRDALAVDSLGLLLVVPESGRERLPLELLYVRLEFGEVKDAPLAP